MLSKQFRNFTISNVHRMEDSVTAHRSGECEMIGGNDRGRHAATSDHNEVHHVAPTFHSRSETREDSVDAKPIGSLSPHPSSMDNSTNAGTLPSPERALSVPADDTTPSRTVQAGGDSSDARSVIKLHLKIIEPQGDPSGW